MSTSTSVVMQVIRLLLWVAWRSCSLTSLGNDSQHAELQPPPVVNWHVLHRGLPVCMHTTRSYCTEGLALLVLSVLEKCRMTSHRYEVGLAVFSPGPFTAECPPMPSHLVLLWCGKEINWCGHKLRPNHTYPFCLNTCLGRTLQARL